LKINELNNVYKYNDGKIQIVEIKDENCDFLDFVIFLFPVEKESCEKIRQLVEKYRSENAVCIVGFDNDEVEYYNNDELFSYYIDFSKIFDISGSINNPSDFDSLVDIFYGCKTELHRGTHKDFIDSSSKKSNLVSFFSEYADTFDDAAQKIYNKLSKQCKWMKSNDSNLSFFNTLMLITTAQEDLKENDVNSLFNAIYEFGKPDFEYYYYWNHLIKNPDKGKYRISLLCNFIEKTP